MSRVFKFYTSEGEAFHADIAALSHAFMDRYPGLPSPAYSANQTTFAVVVAGIKARWKELDLPGEPACARRPTSGGESEG